MAKTNKQTKKDYIQFKCNGTIKFIGYGNTSYSKEEASTITFIPDNADEIRQALAALYDTDGIDQKWIPDFVLGKKEGLSLKSKYDIPLGYLDENDEVIESNVREFIHDHGTPVKGTEIKVVFKYGEGSIYPVALKINKKLQQIATYSLDNLFDF